MLVPITIRIDDFVPSGFMRCMRSQDHALYRRLFVDALRADVIAGWEPELRRILRRTLAELVDAGTAPMPSAERLVRALDRIATRMLIVLFFGLRPDQQIFVTLEEGFHRLGPEGFEHVIGSEQRAAYSWIRSVASQVIELMKRDNDVGLGDSVLRRILRVEGGSALDETVVGNAIYMVEMGRYDIRGLLRWILKYLSESPPIVAELRTTRAIDGGVTRLAEACVLETLRMDQAEVLNRSVAEEFTFDGYRIPKGSAVRILLREAHRDPAIFPDPDRFNPSRFMNRRYSADEYAPFGLGEHRCIVADLVVRLSTLFVEELVAGFNWSVLCDRPRKRGRHHWEPNPSFAIDLRPRPQVAGT